MKMTYKIAVCDDEQIFVDDVVRKIKKRNEHLQEKIRSVRGADSSRI